MLDAYLAGGASAVRDNARDRGDLSHIGATIGSGSTRRRPEANESGNATSAQDSTYRQLIR